MAQRGQRRPGQLTSCATSREDRSCAAAHLSSRSVGSSSACRGGKKTKERQKKYACGRWFRKLARGGVLGRPGASTAANQLALCPASGDCAAWYWCQPRMLFFHADAWKFQECRLALTFASLPVTAGGVAGLVASSGREWRRWWRCSDCRQAQGAETRLVSASISIASRMKASCAARARKSLQL